MSRIKSYISRNRTFVYISCSILSVLILGIISIQILGLRKSNLFAYHIRRAEVLIAENRLEEAWENLNKASSNSRSARNYLMILSRTQQTAFQDMGIILKARKQFPRNQDLLAVHVNHLLTQNAVLEAAELAEKLRKQDYLSLRVESLLRSGRDVENSMLLPVGVPLSPEEMADPQAMISAGLLTGDIRYFVNGAVMYSALGKIDDAFNILMERKELLANHPDTVILLKLAHDLGKYETLPDISPLLPSETNVLPTMLIADMHFYRGETEKSYAVHQSIAGEDALSYTNQLNLVRAHGYNADAPLVEALETYRSEIPVLRHFLALEAESGAEVFRNSLNYYRTLQPGVNLDWIEQLHAYLFADQNYRIQDTILSLWTLVNNDPENREARDLLLYFLSLEGDWEEISSLLQRYDPQYDDTLLVFNGFVSFYLGKRAQAREYFLRASERMNFQASHNLGLFSLEDGNLPEARQWFLLAAEQAQHRTGFSLTVTGTLYYEELLIIRLYEGIVEALSGNNGRALEILNFLLSMEYQHVLLPRLKEMVAKPGIN